MRWDALFDDLESQLESATSAQQESEIRDRTRTEHARLTLVQRLSGQRGTSIDVATRGGRHVSGTLTNVGSQWLALAVEGRSVIVPVSSLETVRGLGRGVGQPLNAVQARLGLGSALRGLSRDRVQVTLWIGAPSSRRSGLIDRVGADFLELGLVGPGEERRASNVRELITVPFASIDTVDAAVVPE
ncbi:hypothetical protein GM708_07360 [Vibrio cholerae]|jgi:hypothetical protein|nr:hypothetical protein [Vibrio cholerae]